MPPHGYERPTQAGPAPRAGFGMRQAAAPDPASDPGDAEADGWGPDGPPPRHAGGPAAGCPAAAIRPAGPGQPGRASRRQRPRVTARSACQSDLPGRGRPAAGPAPQPDRGATPAVPRPGPPRLAGRPWSRQRPGGRRPRDRRPGPAPPPTAVAAPGPRCRPRAGAPRRRRRPRPGGPAARETSRTASRRSPRAPRPQRSGSRHLASTRPGDLASSGGRGAGAGA